MKALVITGNTLIETPWDIEDILSTNKQRSNKEEFEKVQINNFFERKRVNELYESAYLNLEYNKSI
jgi:hypothetical protein